MSIVTPRYFIELVLETGLEPIVTGSEKNSVRDKLKIHSWHLEGFRDRPEWDEKCSISNKFSASEVTSELLKTGRQRTTSSAYFKTMDGLVVGRSLI